MSRWFRHYAGMMRDDKLVRVAIRSKQTIERVVWVYAAILESAAEIDDDGRYDFDAAEAAYFLRADEDDVASIVGALDAAGRLSEGRVVKWGDRQFKSDRSAERQARYRERQRTGDTDGGHRHTSANGDGHSNKEVTSRKRHGDAPETETETEVSVAKATSPRPWALPVGVSLQVWTDFLANRKKKRLSNSPTAWKAFNDDLRRISQQSGIPPPVLIEHAAAKGWGGIYDPNEREQPNGRTNTLGRHQPADGLSSTARAALQVFGP